MDVRRRRIESLERILRELLEIDALTPGVQAQRFRAWLDLAIAETRAQIEKTRAETVH
jgi:hypothetical protein